MLAKHFCAWTTFRQCNWIVYMNYNSFKCMWLCDSFKNRYALVLFFYLFYNWWCCINISVYLCVPVQQINSCIYLALEFCFSSCFWFIFHAKQVSANSNQCFFSHSYVACAIEDYDWNISNVRKNVAFLLFVVDDDGKIHFRTEINLMWWRFFRWSWRLHIKKIDRVHEWISRASNVLRLAQHFFFFSLVSMDCAVQFKECKKKSNFSDDNTKDLRFAACIRVCMLRDCFQWNSNDVKIDLIHRVIYFIHLLSFLFLHLTPFKRPDIRVHGQKKSVNRATTKMKTYTLYIFSRH